MNALFIAFVTAGARSFKADGYFLAGAAGAEAGAVALIPERTEVPLPEDLR